MAPTTLWPLLSMLRAAKGTKKAADGLFYEKDHPIFAEPAMASSKSQTSSPKRRSRADTPREKVSVAPELVAEAEGAKKGVIDLKLVKQILKWSGRGVPGPPPLGLALNAVRGTALGAVRLVSR